MRQYVLFESIWRRSFLGVLDDGTVLGVPEKAASDMVKNFIKVISNPSMFSPTVYLLPEIVKYDENHNYYSCAYTSECMRIH